MSNDPRCKAPDWANERVTESWLLGEGAQAGFIEGPLVYINDPATASKLGCPAEECGCFFNFSPQRAWRPRLSKPCKMRFKPLVGDNGRDWCVCTVEEPSWLAEQHPKPWQHEREGLTLAHLTGGNPTHQLHIHFFWIWMWLVHIVERAAGQVSLLLDCEDVNVCMGTYGIGLAKAILSEPIQLRSLTEPLVVDRIKFGLGGTFPFSLWEMQPWGGPQPEYVSMVAAVKAHYNIEDHWFSKPLQIVLAKRPGGHKLSTRVIRNVDELAASLEKRGFDVQVVEFGKLSFAEQLQAVANATILAGISGSDMVTGVFLPRGAGIVEILPQVKGHQVINVELHNIMRLAQVRYHRWHSPTDADLLYDDQGNLLGDTLLRQIGTTDVDIPGGTANIEAAALEAGMLQTDRVGEIWFTQDPVNATMFPAPSIGEAARKYKEREEAAWNRTEGVEKAKQKAKKHRS
ncbi:hypothetical protein WJX73_010325 [Symbiochloris irregularis]|uniref:Glycosyltransferase 61 catalytic domain-containing protein n=1 Tax=Symbiochloris irregularis TaxID=706552 RepID=A0AAW1NPJ1_9CHLO